jgi:hypothetical protein
MYPDALDFDYTEGLSLVCLPLMTVAVLFALDIMDEGAEASTLEVSETRFLVLEAADSVHNVYRRVGRFELHRNVWLEGSGITINTEGKTVYTTVGKPAKITLI